MGKKKRIGFMVWGSVEVVLLLIALFWNYLGRNIFDLLNAPIGSNEIYVCEVISDEDSIINTEKVTDQKQGVEASYPRVLSGASPESLERWNEIIKQDFDKIVQIYSFQPYPGPTPSSTDVVPIILRISYEVKGNTNSWLSLFYRADYSSIYSAHPSNLIYTTNIDKRQDRRLQLSDIVILNKDFVKEFRTWKLADTTGMSNEIQEAIDEYINKIPEEDLLTGFRSADQIGSNNPWGIYSYLTKDRLGISVEIPHYAGDHAEFEQSFSELKSKGLLQKK